MFELYISNFRQQLCPALHLYLVHADVALVAEHHVVSLLAVRRAAHVADDVLVILNPQALHCVNGMLHVVVALALQRLHGALHRQLVQGLLPWGGKSREETDSEKLIGSPNAPLPARSTQMCSKSDFTGHFTLDSPLTVLTHASQLPVECVQPVEVHVVQVIAAHVLRQLPDVDITQFCRLLTGGLDVFPLVAIQHLLGPLC